MTIFNLPDLGEGLPDAEIHEWFVKEGDKVALDQPLVAMETAKAVVDIPCPQSGTIAKLYGQSGDILKTGAPLVEFMSEEARSDKGTVVGNLEESDQVTEDNFSVGSGDNTTLSIKATPLIKALAKKLNVNLTGLAGSGENGFITRQDVEKAQQQKNTLPEGFISLKGTRRGMLNSMTQSHQVVVPVSIFDEVDIQHWDDQADTTVRLIQAIISACSDEPALNVWFNTEHAALKQFKDVHLGLAMDTPDGLFVPVIHHAQNKSPAELRCVIDHYKSAVVNRDITPELLKGATITLSNFGKFAGRFASPIIVPPSVAILAAGRIYQRAILTNDGTLKNHRCLPLSLSFDHRAVTGGEATRFLGAVISSLSKHQS